LQLTILGNPVAFVAKTCFDVGAGRGKKLEKNEIALMNDLVALKRLAIFRDQFFDKARTTGAEVASK
jgi:hypothetical protein